MTLLKISNIECGFGLKEGHVVGNEKPIENLFLVGCCVINKSNNKLLNAKTL